METVALLFGRRSWFRRGNSLAREDAIKLAHMRTGLNSCPLPLVSQIAVLDDVKAGKPKRETARTLGISDDTVTNLIKRGPIWRHPLPVGFSLLVGRR